MHTDTTRDKRGHGASLTTFSRDVIAASPQTTYEGLGSCTLMPPGATRFQQNCILISAITGGSFEHSLYFHSPCQRGSAERCISNNQNSFVQSTLGWIVGWMIATGDMLLDIMCLILVNVIYNFGLRAALVRHAYPCSNCS